MGYDPSDFEEEDFRMSEPEADKSIRGYRIVIVILSVILVALSALYYSLNRQQQRDYELLQVDRDSIQSNLGQLMVDFDNLQVTNDTISASLNFERERADSLMEGEGIADNVGHNRAGIIGSELTKRSGT